MVEHLAYSLKKINRINSVMDAPKVGSLRDGRGRSAQNRPIRDFISDIVNWRAEKGVVDCNVIHTKRRHLFVLNRCIFMIIYSEFGI